MINKLKDYNNITKEELILYIKQYLLEQKELCIRKAIDEEEFSKPSWSEHQAYLLGMTKAFSKAYDFLP